MKGSRFILAILICLAAVTVGALVMQRIAADPLRTQEVSSVALSGHYIGQDLVLISTSQGRYRATNDGWKLLHPPGSRRISVSLGGVLYYGSSEIWRSVNGGETWTLTGHFPFTETNTSEVLSASPVTDTIFIVVGYEFPDTGALEGVYRSTDCGATWVKVFGNPGTYTSRIIFSPNFAQDGTAFVAFEAYRTAVGVWKTEDWGETWFESSDGLPVGGSLTGHALSISPQFAQDQTIFASSDYGVYKSIDGGESWFEVGDPPGFHPVDIAISPDYVHDQTLLTGDYDEDLFLSQDGGESWQPLDFFASPRYVGIRHVGPFRPWPASGEVPTPGPYHIYLPLMSIGYRALEFWVVADHPWPEPDRLYRSRDYGVTWEEVWVFERNCWLYLPLVSQR